MMERSSIHHEYPSSGALAATYYAGGGIKREPHVSVPDCSSLTGFRIVDVQCVRSGKNITEAYEITLQILGNRQALQELQPGVVFALEPKNHMDTVNAVLQGLRQEGAQRSGEGLESGRPAEKVETVELPVKTAYLEKHTTQSLDKREVLSGTVDLSRPTVQLVNLLLKRRGLSASLRTAERIAASHSIEQLLEKYPGLVSIEELCANQPPLNSRPYTLSGYDREAGTIKIVVSDVEAQIPPMEPGAEPECKRHGIATRMLIDLARNPDAWGYTLNGSLSTHGPKLFFPSMSRQTPGMDAYRRQTENTYWQGIWERFSQQADAGDKTLFLLGTGSGIAPYLALLREYAQQGERYPGKVVLINGGRGPKGEMFQDEIRQFLNDKILDAYHYADSTLSLPDGEKGRVHNVLKAKYGEELRGLLAQEKAMVYVCGAKEARDDVDAALAEIAGFGRGSKEAGAFVAELEDKCLIQSTASKPDRFFTFWREQQSELPSYWLPQTRESWTAKVGGKSASTPEAWAKRIVSPELPGREATR